METSREVCCRTAGFVVETSFYSFFSLLVNMIAFHVIDAGASGEMKKEPVNNSYSQQKALYCFTEQQPPV